MSYLYTVVHPFHYTVSADSFNEAIKNFVKTHKEMNIGHLIIKDQNKHMEARIKRYWQDGRNFMGLNVYPVDNPVTGNVDYMNYNPYPHSGWTGAAALPTTSQEFDFTQRGGDDQNGGMVFVPPVIPVGGVAPQGVTSLSTLPQNTTVTPKAYAQTGMNVISNAAGSTVVQPTYTPTNVQPTVLPPILSPAIGTPIMGAPMMGGPVMGGPMITSKNKYQGAPVNPATSVIPTFDQNGKRHFTMATSYGNGPYIMSPGMYPAGLVSNSLGQPGKVDVSGTVTATPTTPPASPPASASATSGTTPAPASGTATTGTTPAPAPAPAPSAPATPGTTYNVQGSLNLGPSAAQQPAPAANQGSIPGMAASYVNPITNTLGPLQSYPGIPGMMGGWSPKIVKKN